MTRKFPSPRRARTRGFTILEIIVVLLIIAILSALLIESYVQFKDRAERVGCATNLRSLHISLAAYIQDQGHWPQCPYELGSDGFDAWWLKTMSAYKLGLTNWQCPTYQRLQREGKADKQAPEDKRKLINYIPTPFDAGERTPFKWPTQPWAVEIGDFHGDGNLIIFPDGSIRGFNQFSAEHR